MTDTDFDDEYYYPPGYTEALTGRGWTIHANEWFGDYQGDQVILAQDPAGKLNMMIFGYGSCSGCDARQGCRTAEEFDRLLDHIIGAARTGTARDLLTQLTQVLADELEWYTHEGGFSDAADRLKAKLRALDMTRAVAGPRVEAIGI